MATVWLPFASAYFLSFGLRNVNAVLAPDLTAALVLDAADLGLLTSVYYFAFALVQLPAGILLDRYGPRRINSLLMLVAASGCVLHAVGRSFPELMLGRALIGIGMSVGLMSAVKAFAQWLPMTRLPLAINLLLAFGGLGAMAFAGPVGWALHYVSWRAVFGASAVMLVVASGFLYLVAPDRGEVGENESFMKLAAGFGTAFRSHTFWRLGLMLALIAGTYTAMQSLWIGPWLRDVGGLGRDAAIAAITAFALGTTIGYLVIGAGCDWLIGCGVTQLALYKIQTGTSIVIFSLITLLDGSTAIPLWAAFFAVGSGGSLVLAILARTFSAHLAGRVNTAVNVLMFVVSFAFQWGIGAVLDQWPVTEGRYSAAGYQAAFAVLLALQLVIYAILLIGEHSPLKAARALASRD